MRVLALVMGVMLAAGAAAWAADTAPGDEAAGASAQKVSDQERVVCKQRKKPNSRFVTRECHTVAEWEARRETARKAFFEVQDRPMTDIQKGN